MGVASWLALCHGSQPMALYDFQNDTGSVVSDRAGGTFNGAYNAGAQARPGVARSPDGRFGYSSQNGGTLASGTATSLVGGTAYSIESLITMWTAFPAGAGIGIFQMSAGGDGNLMVRAGDAGLRGGQLQWRANGGNNTISDAGHDLRAGQAYHICETTDGSATRFYVNGVLLGSGASTTVGAGGTIQLNAQASNAGRAIAGSVWGVVVYAYTLAPSAVAMRAKLALSRPPVRRF